MVYRVLGFFAVFAVSCTISFANSVVAIYDPFDVPFDANNIPGTYDNVFAGAGDAYGPTLGTYETVVPGGGTGGRIPYSRNPSPPYSGAPVVSPVAANAPGRAWQSGRNTGRTYSGEGSGHSFDREFIMIKQIPGTGPYNSDSPPVEHPGVWGGLDSWMAYDIRNNPSANWTKPVSLELRANMNPNYSSQTTNLTGLGLGYWSSLPANNVVSTTGFTGLMLRNDGRLQLIINGTASATGFATITATNPPADSGTAGLIYSWPELRYQINTTTGNIESLTLTAAPNSGTLTINGLNNILTAAQGQFTDARTNFTGFVSVVTGPSTSSTPITTTEAYGDLPKADNFTLLIPEPTGLAMLMVSGLIFLRRKRYNALP